MKLICIQYQTKRSKEQGERAGCEMYSVHAADCKDVLRDKREHDGFKFAVKGPLQKFVDEHKYAGLKVHPCCKAGKLAGYHEGGSE